MNGRTARLLRVAAAARVPVIAQAVGVEPSRALFRREHRRLKRMWTRTPWKLRARVRRMMADGARRAGT